MEAHSDFFLPPAGCIGVTPNSLLLFLIVIEALNTLIGRAIDMNLLKGITVGKAQILYWFHTSSSQMTPWIFFHPEVRNLLHLRCILMCFQMVSVLKINISQNW